MSLSKEIPDVPPLLTLDFEPLVNLLMSNNKETRQIAMKFIYYTTKRQASVSPQLNLKIYYSQVSLLAEKCYKSDMHYDLLIRQLRSAFKNTKVFNISEMKYCCRIGNKNEYTIGCSASDDIRVKTDFKLVLLYNAEKNQLFLREIYRNTLPAMVLLNNMTKLRPFQRIFIGELEISIKVLRNNGVKITINEVSKIFTSFNFPKDWKEAPNIKASFMIEKQKDAYFLIGKGLIFRDLEYRNKKDSESLHELVDNIFKVGDRIFKIMKN